MCQPKTCNCCEEQPIWSEAAKHGHATCQDCSRNTFCLVCNRLVESDTLYQWDEYTCDDCAAQVTRSTEMDDTADALKALAAEHEWDVEIKSVAQTGSWYYTLTRECDNCILGSDDDCTCEELTVRISDHGTAYCSEDYSLVIPSGSANPDDHNLEILKRRLSRPKGE